MRLEAKKKLGFYPTPLTVVDNILTLLHFPKEQVSLFDPCCGEGVALQALAQGKNALTYGIELDSARAKQARQNLVFVISGSYCQTKISNNAFSLLYLNPPYDFEEGERKEFIFLRDTVRYLQYKGVLVYIIPYHRLEEKIAKILSIQFENIRVFKFPQDEYEIFKQIVILGIKKDKPELDIALFQKLLTVRENDIPEIPRSQEPLYLIPGTKFIPLFKSVSIDIEVLKKSLAKSPLWERIETLTSKTGVCDTKRPPLPLRTGHLALVLASGYLDGEIGEGANLHIVKGRVFKETKESTEVTANEIIKKKTDVIKISIKILQPNGEIKILI